MKVSIKISIISIIVSILLTNCFHKSKPILYDHTAAIIDLGNDYYYLGDASESQILLNSKPGAKSKVGEIIIPPEVIQYNYDESFIIAQTLEKVNGKKSVKYWIVYKAKKNEVAAVPLDSISFYKSTDSLGIKIKLKPRQ